MTASDPAFNNLSIVASDGAEAQEAAGRLMGRYQSVSPAEADAIIALGGDGLMLRTLQENIKTGAPIYGMHRGSIGFLMNEYSEEDLRRRLEKAEINVIHPLRILARNRDGEVMEALAINEVSLFRQCYQAAKLQILVDGKVRLPELICDGVLVATPAGSTAYNLSAYGPLLPINSPLLTLTPISPFRPRRWRGALLPDEARVEIRVLQPENRPVSMAADNKQFRSVETVEISIAPEINLQLMFDPGHALDERILKEQFQ